MKRRLNALLSNLLHISAYTYQFQLSFFMSFRHKFKAKDAVCMARERLRVKNGSRCALKNDKDLPAEITAHLEVLYFSPF